MMEYSYMMRCHMRDGRVLLKSEPNDAAKNEHDYHPHTEINVVSGLVLTRLGRAAYKCVNHHGRRSEGGRQEWN